MVKKFILELEVEEGHTDCYDCPFHDTEHGGCGNAFVMLDCNIFDLTTLIIKEV